MGTRKSGRPATVANWNAIKLGFEWRFSSLWVGNVFQTVYIHAQGYDKIKFENYLLYLHSTQVKHSSCFRLRLDHIKPQLTDQNIWNTGFTYPQGEPLDSTTAGIHVWFQLRFYHVFQYFCIDARCYLVFWVCYGPCLNN